MKDLTYLGKKIKLEKIEAKFISHPNKLSTSSRSEDAPISSEKGINPISGNNQFEIFEKSALDNLKSNNTNSLATSFIPLPVKLIAFSGSVLVLFGLIWAFVARIPIQVNGFAAFVPIGGLDTVIANESGTLYYQADGMGGKTLTSNESKNNEIIKQFWLKKAINFSDNLADFDLLLKSVRISLEQDRATDNLIQTNYQNDIDPNNRITLGKNYSHGTIMAIIENVNTRESLNSVFLSVLPTVKNYRTQKLNKVNSATQLIKINKLKILQTYNLSKELDDKLNLLKRLTALWENGYVSALQIYEERNKINALKSQIIDNDSSQLTNNINRKNILAEYNSLGVNELDSINRLQNNLVSYLSKSRIFAPTNGFYIVSRNFPNFSIVKSGDEILSFTRKSPELPNVVPVFLDSSASQQTKVGNKVLVTPNGISRAEYGGIKGTVIEVFKLPVQGSGLVGILGSNSLASLITKSVPVPVLVQIKLEQNLKRDCIGTESYNCYIWSSNQKPPYPVRMGTVADVQITTLSRAPISFVMPFFRRLAGFSVDNRT